MRRKSERSAIKKAKVSPDKKEKEKVKRKSTRRRKPSSSSDNESAEEVPVQPSEVSEIKTDPSTASVKEDSPEESQDQVWQVKAAGSSGDVGEIQKLKICLTRPPSTPERVDRSPRSKRKHSRATSSSDTPSTESDDKKKSRHRSKRSTESKEESEKNQDSYDEPETDSVPIHCSKKSVTPESNEEKDVSVSDTKGNIAKDNPKEDDFKKSDTTKESVVTDPTQVSTTNKEDKDDKTSSMETDENPTESNESQSEIKQEETTSDKSDNKTSDADTTVVSPQNEIGCDKELDMSEKQSPKLESSMSGDPSEVLELQAEDSRCESSVFNLIDAHNLNVSESAKTVNLITSEVSISENKTDFSGTSESNVEKKNSTNINDVVECSQSIESETQIHVPEDVNNEKKHVTEDVNSENINKTLQESKINSNMGDNKTEIPNSIKQVPTASNGETTVNIVINRKRRWGSRPTNQKSITISTDILKEIIPDVKPVEFEEVVEEKKHKRVEVPEHIERPVLPKIIIDNSENAKKDQWSENKDKENVRNTDVHSSATRKISIVKENDSIIARPPSPPRHQQSNILYITNLVRPFTLLQLKNLLQRTGKILDDGFWIDRIKSKCFVKYEKEDQAVETRHALHGVRWPVSNPKTLHVDFSTEEEFNKAQLSETADSVPASTIPGTVEDWLREQDMKRDLDKPWERKQITREWDVGKNDKDKDPSRQMDKYPKDERLEKRRHRSAERSPEPVRKFKKKEEEPPAKLLDDLFRKTKTTPCIYWLPLSAETIAIKEEQRRQHMAEHERRLQELRRTHRRH